MTDENHLRTMHLYYLILANVKFNSNNLKLNLNQAKRTVLKDLKFNENIIIIKANNGGQRRIIDKNYYI